jgi:hypothetical protein
MTVGMAAAILLLAGLAASPAGATVARNEVASFENVRAIPSIAVDNSAGPSRGDVYVAEGLFGGGEISKLTAAGAPTGVTIEGQETPQSELEFVGEGAAGGIQLAQIAVDSSAGVNSGDLYVANIAYHVVDKFTEAGKYVCQITGSETPSPSECNGVAGSKTPAGSMTPSGLTISTNGDVYVSDAAHDVIDVFGPEGEYLTQYADPKEEPGSLAINTAGDLYVASGSATEPTGVLELSTAKGGSVVSAPELEATEASALGVDRSTGEVILGGILSTKLTDFEASGTKIATFGEGGAAIAIDEASDEIYTKPYLGDGSREVIVFGPFAIVPNEVTTGVASEVGEEAATLHGHVVPDPGTGGEISECFFEYGTTSEYGQKAACEQAVPHPGGGEVTAKVKISSGSTYHFRLVAKDPGNGPDVAGSAHGGDETLTTFGAPIVENEASTARTTSATVRATVDLFGVATTSCEVQYVDEASFEASGYAGASTAPCNPAELAAGFTTKAVSGQLSGLSVATTYHYRVVVTSASKVKTSEGADETFATFGIKSFSMEAVTREGTPYTQAGGHPYALTIAFELNASSVQSKSSVGSEPQSDANLKDVIAELPPGLIGNATTLPRCTPGQLSAGECSGATQVGVIDVLQGGYQGIEGQRQEGIPVADGAPGLYNIVPPAGVPVEFGANIGNDAIVYIKSTVRPGGDYGVVSTVENATTDVGVTGSVVELWGVPAEASHNAQRRCPQAGEILERVGCSAGVEPKPFLSNPSLCGAQQTAKLRVDAWQAPGQYVERTSTMPATTGCNKIAFAPSISVLPDTDEADSPSGVSVKLHVAQNESDEGLTAPSLRDAVVTLPAGVTLNPAAANGLASCSEAAFGLHNGNPVECPSASKVGSIEIETPLLPNKLTGSAYLAEENKNPFGSTFALYVSAEGEGAMVKVAGKVEPNPVTGQLVSSFDETPEVPFSDFRLHFFGGPRAPLASPKVCGTYTTTSILTPWSAPESGPLAEPTIPFNVTKGPGGTPCSAPGFSPSFTAGTTSVQAGGYTPFTLTMGRNDGEQNLGTIKTALPEGLTGVLSGVPLCPEPQASEGTCSAASQIGHVVTGVGAGPFPLFVPAPGAPADPVYLTGPYKGASFGLSVVVPAEAGPFNLDENGRPVVVRAKVSINPVTAQVTVESDPLPQMLKGVPLDIRDVNVVIERSKFLINPTNCEPTRIDATLTSAGGIVAEPSAPFQVTDCAALGFNPGFAVAVSGKTSRADGASLHVKLTYPSGTLGKDANIHEVKVELPRQLPSRLSTLQQACLASVFDVNPASCPAASKVGYAKAVTPILAVPLEGPAYFVSYGGAKFPELVLVLQGYGITIDLHGETFISKNGITSSTFKTVPDQPVSSFELTLPKGPYSALGANVDLCKAGRIVTRTKRVRRRIHGQVRTVKVKVRKTVRALLMPTTFVAQDGSTIHQTTTVAVTGCGKAGKAR